ncbi:MAG: BatD family protein [Lentisphaeria bacterium]|nr:BatD family protein [Lentisphaeria bacterium]
MRFILSLFFLSVLCGTTWGAAIAQATVDQNAITTGGTIKLYLQVIDENGDDGAEMSLPTLPKDFPFQVLRQAGPSTSTQSYLSFTNGRRQQSLTRTNTMVYLLKAAKSGSYQIPSIAVPYGKTTLQTKPIPIRVLDSPQQNANRQPGAAQQETPIQTAVFRQYLSSDTTVMGAPVYLTFELMVPQQMELRKIAPDIPLETLLKDFRLDGVNDAEWDRKSLIQDGLRYLIVTKNLRLTPKHPGKFTIPPSCMNYYTASQDNRRRSRGFFDDPFFDDPFDGLFGGGSLKENTAASDEVILTVEDFPEEGRPENYSGLIGPLTASVHADITDVYVGDPITITITLHGNTLNEEDRLPDLKAGLEADGHFRLSGNDPAHLNDNGDWECTRTLRVLSPKVNAIPALKIPYYDLTTKKYDFATTKSIPLNVQEAKKITLQDANIPVALPTAVLPEQPETQLTELSGVTAGADWLEVCRNTWSPLPSPSGRKGLLFWFLIPAGAWLLGFAGITIARKSSKRSAAEIAARGAKSALKHALSQIDDQAGDAGRRLGEALQAFLASRFGFSGAVTTHDLQAALQQEGYSDDTAAPLQELLSQCEAAQYGGAVISATELKDRILLAVKPL